MNKKSTDAAIIDIGSSEVKLIIAQTKDNRIEVLDHLVYPINLGSEVFATGRASHNCVAELVHAITGFSELLSEYEITNYTAMATTALREAANRSFIIDQIQVKTGIRVQVLEDNQEKLLIYHEMQSTMEEAGHDLPGRSLFLFTGSGTIGIAFLENGFIYDSMNIPLGSLKIQDMMKNIESETDDYGSVLSEYLQSEFTYDKLPDDCVGIKNIVLTGSMIDLIADLTGASRQENISTISVSALKELYSQIKNTRTEQIAIHFGIPESQAELLYAALSIYVPLISFTNAKKILSPKAEMGHCIMKRMLYPDAAESFLAYKRANALACAKTTAYSCNCDTAHAEYVRNVAVQVFDALTGLHGLGPHSRLLLEIASILHEAGHAISARNHLDAGFDFIRHTDLCGITKEDMLIVACIASVNEHIEPDMREERYRFMSDEMRSETAKLIAIFRLANSIDNTHTQKIRKIKVRVEGNTLEIEGSTSRNVFLEKWALGLTASFFIDVYALHPQLKIHSRLSVTLPKGE